MCTALVTIRDRSNELHVFRERDGFPGRFDGVVATLCEPEDLGAGDYAARLVEAWENGHAGEVRLSTGKEACDWRYIVTIEGEPHIEIQHGKETLFSGRLNIAKAAYTKIAD